MAILCPKSVRALAGRITQLDECGVPVPEATPNSRATFAAFVSLSLSADVEEGEEILVKNAGGAICIQDQDCDRLKGFDLTLQLCGAPLPVLEMLLGLNLLLSDDGVDTIGGVLPAQDAEFGCDDFVGFELWTRNADVDACTSTTSCPYVQFLLPRTKKWSLGGDLEFASSEIAFELTGFAEENPQFDSFVAGEWNATQIAAIQAGGPLAWKCVDSLPNTDDCDYGTGA